jgi:ATP-dependent exoDNAse (exonuclease V) beta subunit
VRLPADLEDDPPFADFPDRLGRVADQLADWQEDLRILYVACTRARDVLILSAGLAEPVAEAKPASHWMLALAERFDLRTGKGVVEGVSACVRVVEKGLEVEDVKLNVEARKPTDDRPWALRPLPQHLPPCISLCALEQFAHGEPVAAIADVCAGSWLPLRDRLAAPPAHESTFWAVLRRWDFADLDGWRPLLAESLSELPNPAAANRLAEELKPLFERFAASEVRGQLAGAAERFREIEFLFNLTHALSTTDTPDPRLPGSPPVLRGLVDLLFRDGDGWHLYGVHLTERAGRHPWRERKPWLTVQAWAVAQRFGAWPRTVGLLDLVNGEVFAEPGKAMKATTGFGAVCGALKSWLGQSEDFHFSPFQ